MKNSYKALMLAAALCTTAGAVRAQNGMRGAGMGMSDMRAKNAQMLIQTLSEEKTEINALAAQQAQFRKMNDSQSRQIASMFGRWIREHKAAGPTLMKLIRENGGDPNQAKILKPPVLGSKMQMLEATHMDHQKAVMTSQMRYSMTNSRAVKTAMHKRGNLARKHLKQMEPYMRSMNGNMAGGMMNGRHSDMSGGMAPRGGNSAMGAQGPR